MAKIELLLLGKIFLTFCTGRETIICSKLSSLCSCICVNLYSWTFVVIFKTRCDLVNEDLSNFFINSSRLKRGQLVSFSLTPLRCSVSQQLWTSWRPRYLLNVFKPSVPLEITVTLRGGQEAPNLFSQIF